ncbi:MAG: type II secretion system protein N [Casimicrobiaceae bacterium]
MRRVVLLLAIAACLLAVALAWRAPATLVSARLARLADQGISLADAQGTIWRGQATLVAGEARMPLAWRIHPLPLLRGEIVVTLYSLAPTGDRPTGEVHATAAGMHVATLRVNVPAAAIAAATLARPRLDAGGEVEIDVDGLDWPLQRSTRGTLAATWRGARLGLAGSERIDLGDVTATLRAQSDGISGPLANTGGAVAIDGELLVQADGGGLVRGLVRPRRDQDPTLEWLRALGTPDGGGVRLEWRWPAP